jgi:hypothetical protein
VPINRAAGPLPQREGNQRTRGSGLKRIQAKNIPRSGAAKFDLTTQYGPGAPEEVALPDFSGPWQLATSPTLAPRAEAISESERPACC